MSDLVGGDPEAMLLLARRLDEVADRLDRAVMNVECAVGGLDEAGRAISVLSRAADWAGDAPPRVRKRAEGLRDLQSPGGRGVWGAFTDSLGHALADLAATPGALWSNARRSAGVVQDVIEGDFDEAGREITAQARATVGRVRELVERSARWTPGVGNALLLVDVRRNGVQHAARQRAADLGAMLPDVAAAVVGGGAGAVAKSAAKAAARFAPPKRPHLPRRTEPAIDDLAKAARDARRAAIAVRVEGEAKRRLLALEARVPGAHAIARHGPETTLEEQWDRAMTGLKPDGQHGPRQAGSRFFSYRIMERAIEEATRLRRIQPRDEIEFDMKEFVGEGYLKSGEYVVTTNVVVRFNDLGVYTAFPRLVPPSEDLL